MKTPRLPRLLLFSFLALCLTASALATNPVPLVDEIAPISVRPGSGDLTLHLRGLNFAPGAVVNWTAGTAITPLATTYHSRKNLTATVSASLLATPGTFTITVANPAGTPLSNSTFFNVTIPAANLGLQATNLTVGENEGEFPRTFDIQDYNNDGYADLAVVNPSAESVSIELGNGDGTFTAAPTLNVSLDPVSIASGDFNNDGQIDLAVSDYNGTLYLFLGNGDGTFVTGSIVQGLPCCPRWVTAADVNRDGKLDLVVDALPGIVILLGNGDGTFRSGPSHIFGYHLTSVVAGDFNNDGYVDLAVTDDNFTLWVLLGSATGFGSVTSLPAPFHPGPATLGDLNGDGNLDIVLGDINGNAVAVYLGNGDGTFNILPEFLAGPGAFATAIGSLDGNKFPDLVVGNYSANAATVWHGNGDGTFVKGHTIPTGAGPTFIGLGDFNGDGLMDFVTGQELDDTVTVVLQTP